ncbi:MAG: hypothetical protein ACI91T_000667 [Natronomonas sp.]|jgi:hypothetical protein
MVEKITLFEPHFDGATFGPANSSAESTTDETVVEEAIDTDRDVTGSNGGRGRKIIGLVVASVVVSVVVSTIARRLAGDDDFEAIEFEGREDQDEEPIDVVEE